MTWIRNNLNSMIEGRDDAAARKAVDFNLVSIACISALFLIDRLRSAIQRDWNQARDLLYITQVDRSLMAKHGLGTVRTHRTWEQTKATPWSMVVLGIQACSCLASVYLEKLLKPKYNERTPEMTLSQASRMVSYGHPMDFVFSMMFQEQPRSTLLHPKGGGTGAASLWANTGWQIPKMDKVKPFFQFSIFR